MKNNRKLKPQTESKSHITKEALITLLKLGVVLTVAVAAPGSIKFLASLIKGDDETKKYYPSSISRQVKRLWRRGIVDVRETKNGFIVCISEKGKKEILSYDVDTMNIPKPPVWDKKWRMVFFDIPASDRARIVFQRKLRSLGFFQMQESVYVYPYPCEKEIKYLREIWELPHSVKLATIQTLENDEDIRHYFAL